MKKLKTILVRKGDTMLIATLNRANNYYCQFTNNPFYGWETTPSELNSSDLLVKISELNPEIPISILENFLLIASTYSVYVNILKKGISIRLPHEIFVQYDLSDNKLTIGCHSLNPIVTSAHERYRLKPKAEWNKVALITPRNLRQLMDLLGLRT